MSLGLPLPRGTFWEELHRLFIAHAERLGYEHPIVELDMDDGGVLFEADGIEHPQPERWDLPEIPTCFAEAMALPRTRTLRRVAPSAPPQRMHWCQLVSRSVVRDTFDELTPQAPPGSKLTAFYDFIATMQEDEIAKKAARRILAIATAEMYPAAEARRQLRAREARDGAGA